MREKAVITSCLGMVKLVHNNYVKRLRIDRINLSLTERLDHREDVSPLRRLATAANFAERSVPHHRAIRGE